MHNWPMEIEFDPAKAQSNWHKHGVSFAHAQAALQDAFAVTIEDPDAFGEQRFLTLGMDALGRVLVVCHTPRGERTRLISARKASKGETGNYHA
nr:BrnT family toxin [uncultured Albidiferax sp.]